MPKKASIAGAVVAGFPSPAEQYLGAPLDLNELLVKRSAATYFVRVKGDSMVNAGIEKPWRMKRGKLSPRATTNWNELLVVG